MALGRRAVTGKRGKAAVAAPEAGGAPPASPAPLPGLPLPSPRASTNLIIADIVLSAAGGLLRDRLERRLLIRNYDKAKAERLVDGRGLAASFALWSASRLARRSPLGLAVVTAGLTAKVLYDRGKRIEAARSQATTPSDEQP